MVLGIVQETKLTNGVYTRGLAGYSVVAMNALSQHCSGVTVFYRPSSRYLVEGVKNFGTNDVGFHLATGEQRWYIVGC